MCVWTTTRKRKNTHVSTHTCRRRRHRQGDKHTHTHTRTQTHTHTHTQAWLKHGQTTMGALSLTTHIALPVFLLDLLEPVLGIVVFPFPRCKDMTGSNTMDTGSVARWTKLEPSQILSVSGGSSRRFSPVVQPTEQIVPLAF